MEKSCFFCTTPFQIITAIHLTMMQEKKSEVDLYVIDQFINAEEVACKVRETGLFRDVIFVKEETLINNRNKSKFFIWIQILYSYLALKRKVKKILQRNFDIYYTHMYISSKAFVPRLVALYYAKKEIDTEIIYFDDGIGSYYDRNILYPRPSDMFVRRIFFGKKAYSANPKKILLYSPDLFYKADINMSESVTVKEIPKWNCDLKLKDITNKVFSYSEKDNIEQFIVIFDGLYTGEKRKVVDTFYEQIAAVVGPENLIIKKHPRDKETPVKILNYYSRSDLPFELICQNSNMEDKLLIGIDTTAIVTPILLLAEEPYVLVLNQVPEFSSSSDLHFNDFRALYKHTDRFEEALTLDEAIEFVKQFCAFKNI